MELKRAPKGADGADTGPSAEPAQAQAQARATAAERPAAASPRRRPKRGRRERRSRYPGWRSQDVMRAAGVVIGLYIALRLLWFAHLLVLTAFLGVLFGLAVTAGVDRLHRWRVPRGVGAPLITFGTIALVVGFFAWSAPALRSQSRELRTKLPEAIDKIDSWLETHRGGILGVFLSDSTAAAPVPQTASTPNALPPAAGDSAQLPRQAPDADSTRLSAQPSAGANAAGTALRQRIFAQVSGAKSYFFGFITSTFAAISGLLIVIFLTIYTAVDPDTYHDGLMHLFPHRSRKRAGEVLTAMATALRKWLVTQLVAMVAIGLVTTIVLTILDVRAALPLGILAGLLEFIPTIGPILSAVPAIAMGFLDSPEKALWVALAYVGIQFLENHLLIPLLMKEGVDIPPALTILAQALMALVFGFLGLLVAVPMLAATMVAVKLLYVEDVVGDASPALTELDVGLPDSRSG
jgi:predicted PurR-regulated permease PerM